MNIKLKINKFFSVLLIFILTLNSHAAIVSDNDGSSFVTKAEFEAMKSSFSKQITDYENSITNKIDGAIASYLAGITISKTSDQSIISYDEDGILSCRGKDDIYWAEGNMSFSGQFQDSVIASEESKIHLYQGYVILKLNGKTLGTGDYFKEALVKNPQYKASDTAEWYGYGTKVHQYISGEHFREEYGGGWQGPNFPDRMDVYIKTFNSLSNVKIGAGASNEMATIAEVANGYADNYNTPRLSAYAATCKRTVDELKNESIIITPTSVSFKRFSNYSNIYDWCNDSDTSDHSALGYLSNLCNSASCQMYYIYDTTKANFTPKRPALGPYVNTTSSTQKKPYFGFVSTLTNWNQLYTTKYDDYLTDFDTYESSLNILKDKDNKRHLALTAGCPLLYLKEEYGVTIPIEFDDTSVDYDLWVKVGSFSSSTAVTADSDCIGTSTIKYGKYGSTISSESGTAANSIKIPNGKKTISFKMPKNGYIFIKWSIAGNSAAGGGTLKIPKTVSVTST